MIEKSLHILAKKSLIHFAKGMAHNPSDYCLFGKQHKVFVSKSSKRKENVINLVYFDVYSCKNHGPRRATIFKVPIL